MTHLTTCQIVVSPAWHIAFYGPNFLSLPSCNISTDFTLCMTYCILFYDMLLNLISGICFLIESSELIECLLGWSNYRMIKFVAELCSLTWVQVLYICRVTSIWWFIFTMLHFVTLMAFIFSTVFFCESCTCMVSSRYNWARKIVLRKLSCL